jgi:hypothetical protein
MRPHVQDQPDSEQSFLAGFPHLSPLIRLKHHEYELYQTPLWFQFHFTLQAPSTGLHLHHHCNPISDGKMKILILRIAPIKDVYSLYQSYQKAKPMMVKDCTWRNKP